jgi:hypothetical protein
MTRRQFEGSHFLDAKACLSIVNLTRTRLPSIFFEQAKQRWRTPLAWSGSHHTTTSVVNTARSKHCWSPVHSYLEGEETKKSEPLIKHSDQSVTLQNASIRKLILVS